MKRYLAIDQSTRQTGYALFEDDGSALAYWPLVSFGYIKTPSRKTGIEAMLFQADNIIQLAIRSKVQAVLYESIYQGVNVKTSIHLARLQGAILAHCDLNDIPAFEVTNAEICGFMRIAVNTKRNAKKRASMRMAMLDLPAGAAEYVRALLNDEPDEALTEEWGGSFCEDTADAIVIGRAGVPHLMEVFGDDD